jgi:hypothetical protein
MTSRRLLYHQGIGIIPFSKIKNTESIETAKKILEAGEPVLVTVFRDKMPKKKKTTSEEQSFLSALAGSFEGYNVQTLNWQQETRSPYDRQSVSYPFIGYRCRHAFVVHSENLIVEEEKVMKRFREALIYAVNQETLALSTKKWVVVGDETGTLDEFKKGKNDIQHEQKSKMCWVAIPPGTELEELPEDFHCAGSGGLDHYIMANNNLLVHDKILFFSFSFDEGRILSNAGKLVRDPHLSFWKETLPLVLEKVAEKITQRTSIDIFVEQVGPLETGIDFAAIIEGYRNSLHSGNAWENLDFNEMWIIGKGEHPWIGYPDAIGANVKMLKTPLLDEKDVINETKIRGRILHSPFRQKSLIDQINPLLRMEDPLKFLTSLSDLKLEDLRDYVEVFLSRRVGNSVSRLNRPQWQELLAHMEKMAEGKNGQDATTLILNHSNMNDVLPILKSDSDQFDFCMALLGTSNHIGATEQAQSCEDYIKNLISGGFQPRPRRMIKFKNLSKGKKDNVFDFSHISEFSIGENPSDEELKFLGSQAQSRALRGGETDLEEAIEIEAYLLSKTVNEKEIQRRMVYHAELLMCLGNYDDAYEYLSKVAPDELTNSFEDLMQDSYFVAAYLKSCVLSCQGEETLKKLAPYIPRLLKDNHPSQRIAYWALRYILDTKLMNPNLLKSCRDCILHLTEVPFFSHDAPGVILACELLDLNGRGINFEANEFYSMVKHNSQETTQAWLELHPPNEEDWLAPLNFNYR